MTDSVIDYPLSKISHYLMKGDISPVELLHLYLRRIEVLNPKLNAYIDLFTDDAIKIALIVEKEILSGHHRGPLHGIPFCFKDFFSYSGTVTGGGTNCFHEKKKITAPVIQSLTKQGMIAIGKNRAVSLGMGASGVSDSDVSPVNPWLSGSLYAPGGSSSGSAVAVAASLSPFAIGTDTGGSTRIPAGWCGVSGFRPSSGKLSLEGVLPLSQTMDTVGLIGKTAGDIRIVYEQLVSRPYVVPRLNSFNLATFPQEELSALNSESIELFYTTLKKIHSSTFNVKIIPFFTSLEECMKVNSIITSFESWRNYKHLCNDDSNLSHNVINKISRGKLISESEYMNAIQTCFIFRKRILSWFNDVDALVIPTTPSTAWLIANDYKYSPPNDFTRFVNFLDLCAVTIPVALDPEGLPFSVQIICRNGDDEKALFISQVIEDRILFKMRPELPN